MQYIEGGITAAKGFVASGLHCGIRKNKSKKDLAMIFSKVPAHAAAVYTLNLVKGAPLLVTAQNIADGRAQAMLCNSGNANTCNADGEQIAREMCRLAGAELGIAAEDIIIASTGVIGEPLSISPIAAAMPQLAAGLCNDGQAAAEAIMTTDTVMKQAAVSFMLGGRECRLGGIAKGSGMIHPNMATMLVFLTTDAAISSALLQQAVSADVQDTFNMISVDGDTSTNDMLSIMANGEAGNAELKEANADYEVFCEALRAVTTKLCRAIAADGEGATKLLQCEVSGAADKQTARTVAKSVICSSLVKAAMFGADANWGRVLCAIGYSGAKVDIAGVSVDFASKSGSIALCRRGAGVPFSEEQAKAILSEKEIRIIVGLSDGEAVATAWGCDLTYDYVRINGDYRS